MKSIHESIVAIGIVICVAVSFFALGYGVKKKPVFRATLLTQECPDKDGIGLYIPIFTPRETVTRLDRELCEQMTRNDFEGLEGYDSGTVFFYNNGDCGIIHNREPF